MIYENRTEWTHRVSHTVIKIGGSFVYVTKVDGTENKPKLYVNHLPNLIDYQFVECSRKDIDVAPFPLGFVNFKDGTCAYYWRSAVRNQFQGLDPDALTGQSIWEQRRLMSFYTLIANPEFVSCLQGIYPSLCEVLKSVDLDDAESPKVLAFDRKFAVARDENCGIYTLFHKMKQVGHSVNGKTWKLGTTHSYVREQAEEVGINVKN